MGNQEGAIHSLLADSNKIRCERCYGTQFYVGGPATDENTDLPAQTDAYAWENSAPTLPHGNMNTVVMMCSQCGFLMGKLAFCFDVCSAMTTPAVTATHIAGVAANGLAGLYVTPLGGTSAGVSFVIASNTAADPTVITVTGAINDNTATEIILISSWKVF